MADQDLPYLDLTAYPPRTRTASEVEEDVSDHVSLRSAGSFSSQTNSEVGYFFFLSFYSLGHCLNQEEEGNLFLMSSQPWWLEQKKKKSNICHFNPMPLKPDSGHPYSVPTAGDITPQTAHT